MLYTGGYKCKSFLEIFFANKRAHGYHTLRKHFFFEWLLERKSCRNA